MTFAIGNRVPLVASCRACGASLHDILEALGSC
jgi:hypothetical protein